MTYTDSDHVPPAIQDALDTMQSYNGVRLPSMLASVTRHLRRATLDKSGSLENPADLNEEDDPVVSDAGEDLKSEESEVDLASDDVSDAWSPSSLTDEWHQHSTSTSRNTRDRDRIVSDLRLAKDAGFRVSCQQNLLHGGRQGIISLAIRVHKLGVSMEALQAWHMDPKQYFVLLIRYQEGYQSLDSVSKSATVCANDKITLRVVLNDRYKVGNDILEAAFAKSEPTSKKYNLSKDSSGESKAAQTLDNLFIARPLNELLNDRLLPILWYRVNMLLPWRGAEEHFNDHQACPPDNVVTESKQWNTDTSGEVATMPSILATDHLASCEKQKSLPLLAMQFTLRHLIRCTEFCLVCHCKIEADFEALKPYVCSKPLCLYQYMNLGFGPSIEHEIITQPHVVDLLISFCYSSATATTMRYLPTGLALTVPAPCSSSRLDPIPHSMLQIPTAALPIHEDKRNVYSLQQKIYTAKFDPLTHDLLFKPNEQVPLQAGSWVMYRPPGAVSEVYHAVVTHVLLPTIRLGKEIGESRNKSHTSGWATSKLRGHSTGQHTTKSPSMQTPATTPPVDSASNLWPRLSDVEILVYDRNFDELDKIGMFEIMCKLLDTLPSVPEMKTYLLSMGGSHVPLASWHDRISPAALGILRWVIASNRSCIMQVDSLEDSDRPSDDRVCGMPGWMQFRLAQGAPDKEERFIQSIHKTSCTSKHPTLFAWHGSSLHNWHGIVREGLHFEHTENGRAFGDGVYHALNVTTSLSYTADRFASYRGSMLGSDGNALAPGQWPSSQLKISSALTLNEIVNAPDRFVSKSPHLVVAQLDWIQSRYLFVTCGAPGQPSNDTAPAQILEQDPAYHPVGSKGQKLIIPLNAISKSRRPGAQFSTKRHGEKKRRADEIENEDIDILSDNTDLEDRVMFIASKGGAVESADPSLLASKGKGTGSTGFDIHYAHTDFVPKSYDPRTLPLIEAPSYATSSTTRTLQRALMETLKTQNAHPSHELGWYIDSDLVTNMYQWIIELHSFESDLLMAQDMKAKNLTSIILEIRFGNQYPISPPFVRVIRPRFLSFSQGGGGHVTFGGALCMELLTNSGWSPVSSIESVLLQVRLAMTSMDPKPARLAPGPVKDYSVAEAVEAYMRACQQHGVSHLIRSVVCTCRGSLQSNAILPRER